MSTTSLYLNAYKSNTHAHSRRLCHASGVKGETEQALRECQSDLQRTVVRRLREEMALKVFSQAALSRTAKRLGYELSQPTIGRILAGKLDPSLLTLQALSHALGIPPWYLLTERDQVEERIIRAPKNVVPIPSPYVGVERRASMLKQPQGKKTRFK
jgi:transcriptional regulator with XRE-family HTH domain